MEVDQVQIDQTDLVPAGDSVDPGTGAPIE